MASPFGNPGTVSLTNTYGPIGMTNAEAASLGNPKGGSRVTPISMGGSAGNLLTIPVILAIGVLAWYAIKTYG